MAKPLIVKISGPTSSKSGRTESQYNATIVTSDGGIRYLTWSSVVNPGELADALHEAWDAKVREMSGQLLSSAAPTEAAAGVEPQPMYVGAPHENMQPGDLVPAAGQPEPGETPPPAAAAGPGVAATAADRRGGIFGR